MQETYTRAFTHLGQFRGEAQFGTWLHRLVVNTCKDVAQGLLQYFVQGFNDKNDPVARNPCLRRGPLSLDYWTRLPGQLA